MKILFWDIETGYNVANIFSLYQKYVPFEALQSERYIICASFKDRSGKRVQSVSLLGDRERFRNDPTDDFYVVSRTHEILSAADAVIAHYGDSFDMKFFNARCIYHGLPPVKDLIQVDTHKMAKKKFLFNSNKLDYLGEFLGVGRKITTARDLWTRCLAGNASAVREMVAYNKQDVLLLEKVFERLSPYCATKLNLAVGAGDIVCPSCGSCRMTKQGLKRTTTRVYQQYKCNACGRWSSSTKSEKKAKTLVK